MSTSSTLTRRQFVQTTAFAATTPWVAGLVTAQTEARSPGSEVLPGDGRAPVRWLDQRVPAFQPGVTWGMPWPRGRFPKKTDFKLEAESGQAVPLQSWPMAFWPDGSIKWSAHAVASHSLQGERFVLSEGTGVAPTEAVRVVTTDSGYEVDTGRFRCRVNKSGRVLIETLECAGRVVGQRGSLVLRSGTLNGNPSGAGAEWEGVHTTVTLEQAGPIRAVLRVEGSHPEPGGSHRSWLRYSLRLYFYAGGESIRIVHTLIYEGDPHQDVVAGIGLRWEVPMRGAFHDRHVRFSGQGDGLFSEAVRGLTGLRRDPGAEVRAAQRAGKATPPVATWDRRVSSRLDYIPAFSDWTLFQASSDGFEITKRTREGFTWLSAARGQRAGGLAYVGSPAGGLAVGIRNFWQSHPAQLDVRGAAEEVCRLTAWLWAPHSGPMDLRPYHDGMGQDTFAKQLEGLEVTYEDYEPGFDSPYGVARTSELTLWVLPETPDAGRLVAMAETVRTPPVLTTTPHYLHTCGVFGGLWSPVNEARTDLGAIDRGLDAYFRFYVSQQEQRRWYGFWNFGDVMHTYDSDRNEWRYDVGGFAWDNSELSTDLWLWLYFLRTGRADVFRFAEAMTRHTGEVDVHHTGRFAPLGSRHNVLHWGCSAKQLRISTAANRRYYYYLTGDERVGDLMREQNEAARALALVQANRKVAKDLVTAPDPEAKEVYAGFGTDWGSLAAAWLTEWERTGDETMRARLVSGMKSIAAQPRGFFTGGARLELATGAFRLSSSSRLNVSHLSAVFGLVEVCAELVQLLEVPEFTRAWLDYCELYNATPEEQTQRLGAPLRGINLQQGHSRLTAFAAKVKSDPRLARRAWEEFRRAGPGGGRTEGPQVRRIHGPTVLQPVDEAPEVSTNTTAQWGLAALQCMALLDGFGSSP